MISIEVLVQRICRRLLPNVDINGKCCSSSKHKLEWCELRGIMSTGIVGKHMYQGMYSKPLILTSRTSPAYSELFD